MVAWYWPADTLIWSLLITRMSNVHIGVLPRNSSHIKDIGCKSRLHAMGYACYVACCCRVNTERMKGLPMMLRCNLIIFCNHYVDKQDISWVTWFRAQFLTLNRPLGEHFCFNMIVLYIFNYRFNHSWSVINVYILSLREMFLGCTLGTSMCLCSCGYGALLGSPPPLILEGTLTKSTYNNSEF